MKNKNLNKLFLFILVLVTFILFLPNAKAMSVGVDTADWFCQNASGWGYNVTLMNDIDITSLSCPIVGKTIIIDLNGKTLTGNLTFHANSKVTITGNGTIIREGQQTSGVISIINSELIIENGNFIGGINPLIVLQTGSNLTINNGFFKSYDRAIVVFKGNDTAATLNIKGGTFETSNLHSHSLALESDANSEGLNINNINITRGTFRTTNSTASPILNIGAKNLTNILPSGTKVVVDGSPLAYTSSTPATINAREVKISPQTELEYNINFDYNTTKGTISASKSKAYPGDTVTLTVTANAGYRLVADSLKYNGSAVVGNTFTMPAENVTITAIFEEVTKYNAIIGTLTGGTITTDKARYEAGETVNLTITPDSGYKLKDGTLKFNSTNISGTSFEMPEKNVTITAEFEKTNYNITSNLTGDGTINTTSTIATVGDEITITFNPGAGMRVKNYSVNRSSTSAAVPHFGEVVEDGLIKSVKFNMPAANVTIYATFETIPPKYNVTIGTFANGTITTALPSYEAGETVTLTITPNAGYRLKEDTLKYNGTLISGNTFTMPEEEVTITAEFELMPYNITVDTLSNGTIIVDKTSAIVGETITLTITPDAGYRLKEGSLKYNGTLISGTTFTMPEEEVTITAEFELIPPKYNITIGTLSNGTITVDKTTAEAGETVNLVIKANAGYKLKEGSVKVNSLAITGLSFTMPDEDVVITAEFEKVYTYEVISGNNAVINVTEASDLKVTIDGDFNLFVKVLVDDKEVDSSNYTVAEGSTIVTLSKAYLSTLSTGRHTMTTVFSNSQNVQSFFNISRQEITNPSTSDNIYLYLVLGTISIIGLSTTLLYKKRFN